VFTGAADDSRANINDKLSTLQMKHLFTLFTLNKLSFFTVPTAALALNLIKLSPSFEIFLAHFVKQVTCCAFQL